MPTDHTETQPRPNVSTEPRDDSGRGEGEQPSDRPEHPNHTPGSRPQEKVEDRPNVGIVTPEDYPKDERQQF